MVKQQHEVLVNLEKILQTVQVLISHLSVKVTCESAQLRNSVRL